MASTATPATKPLAPKAGNSWTSSVSKGGEYVRKASSFRNWISATGSSGFKAEANRYVLYVSHACPWAHRTLITRRLKGLSSIIGVVVVDWLLKPGGWAFNPERDGATEDFVNHKTALREVYHLANPEYTGNITVPALWDTVTNTIVNNESSEIIRMLNSEFQELIEEPEARALDLYPEDKREAIDAVNEWVYPNINNGVYRCGFAQSQEAYEKAYASLFQAMDQAEAILETSRFLTGDDITEADIRLFTTLVRFDHVYFTHFKCNKRRLSEYPNLEGFVCDIYQLPGVADTVNVEHIKNHYFQSHTHINPTGIVPCGPEVNYSRPHGRAGLDSKIAAQAVIGAPAAAADEDEN